jgi:hypothetical protein
LAAPLLLLLLGACGLHVMAQGEWCRVFEAQNATETKDLTLKR